MGDLFSSIKPTLAKKYFHHVFDSNYPHKSGNAELQLLVDEYNKVTGFNITIPQFSSMDEKNKFIESLMKKLERANENIVKDFNSHPQMQQQFEAHHIQEHMEDTRAAKKLDTLDSELDFDPATFD